MKKESKKFDRRVIIDRRIREKNMRDLNRRLFDRRTFDPQNAKLGEILVWKKFITKNQLFEALDKQKGWKLKLGETLIKLGYLKEEELQEALEIQSFEDKFEKFDTDK